MGSMRDTFFLMPAWFVWCSSSDSHALKERHDQILSLLPRWGGRRAEAESPISCVGGAVYWENRNKQPKLRSTLRGHLEP